MVPPSHFRIASHFTNPSLFIGKIWTLFFRENFESSNPHPLPFLKGLIMLIGFAVKSNKICLFITIRVKQNIQLSWLFECMRSFNLPGSHGVFYSHIYLQSRDLSKQFLCPLEGTTECPPPFLKGGAEKFSMLAKGGDLHFLNF